MADHNASGPRERLAMVALACALLFYEIGLTRLLSVVLWYHFAFLCISLAMLGLGLPGLWYSLFEPKKRSLARSLVISAVTLPLSVVAILQGAGHLPRGNTGFIVLAVASILVPMTALGAGICLLLLRARGKEIGAMYGANLLGAMLGAAAVLPLMILAPTPIILALAGLLPLAALLLIREWRGLSVVLGLLIAGAVIWDQPFAVTHNKLYDEREFKPIYEKWTPTARITILPFCPFKKNQQVPWGWGFGQAYRPRVNEQWWIDQDGSAGAPIEHPDGNPETLEHLLFDVTSLGYQVRPPATVAVIGAGGGRDILTALEAGAERVDAIELNGAIVEALSGPFKEFSGDIYHRPGVNAIVGEGRHTLSRRNKQYDLIQISLVDSWSATTAGAYALSENYLYTTEAFHLYASRLTDSGQLTISRFLAGMQQMEGTRLVLLALASLREHDVEDPERHLIVARGRRVANLLLSKVPWSHEELLRLRRISIERGFEVLWPLAEDEHVNATITRAILEGPGFLEEQGFDMRPPTDDRPFFFQALSLLRRRTVDDAAIGFNEFSVVLLQRVMMAVCALAVGLFFLPLLLSNARSRFRRYPGFWRGSGYFAAIGLGFMLVELPFVQRFILYLGHPGYAAALALPSLLLGAGIGSALAGRMVSIVRVVRLGLLLPAVLLTTHVLLGPLFKMTLGSALAVRLCLGLLVLLPGGFLMGFAFPIGMRQFGDGNKAWFWAMNGMASVVGSVVSLALAMMIGFSGVILSGVAAYIMAWLLLREAASSPLA